MNPRLTPVWCLLALALFSQPVHVSAQSSGGSRAAGGVWWEASVGGGGARLTCEACSSERDLGGSLDVSAGTYAANGIRVGMQGGLWSNRSLPVRETLYGLGIEAIVHPRPASGLHVLGGLGWAGYRAGNPDADATPVTLDAVRLRVGVGWDLPLTDGWVAGNRITIDAASFGSLDLDGVVLASSVGLSLVRFAIYVRHP